MKMGFLGRAASVVLMGLLASCAATAAPTTAPATDKSPAATQPPATASAASTAVPVTIVATATAANPPTPAPTLTPSPMPAPAFAPLTSGGCCVQAFFSPDGKQVMYLDKPSSEAQTGIWAVSADSGPDGALAEPQLVTPALGPFSRDMAYAADLVNGRTVVTRLSDSATFPINNGGRSVSFAPDSSHIAWSIQEEAGGFDVRRSELWVANIDGSEAQRVVARFGGGLLAWMPDSQRMLISGKVNRADKLSTLSILDLRDGSTRDLVQVERLRSGSMSPDGHWFIYFVAQASDAALDGTYLLDLQTPNAQPQTLDLFGAYRWRGPNQLLYVPMTLNAPSSELWQLDVSTLEKTQLFQAGAESPFRIANGDWDVSRDGTRLIFLSARDRNIWLARLP